MGITFVPKVLKNGEFQDTYDRDRRANREKSYQKLDTEMIGLVKKKKKKIKPGYKKKSNGRLKKNVNVSVVRLTVPKDVQNVKPKNKLSKICGGTKPCSQLNDPLSSVAMII